MKLTSKSATCAVAVELGWSLVSDHTYSNHGRRAGSVRWLVPDGELEVVEGSGWVSDDAGSGRQYRHRASGRIINHYDGSVHFPPSLVWVTSNPGP